MSDIVLNHADVVPTRKPGNFVNFDATNPILDYPIVRCGDKGVVLAVGREELALAVSEKRAAYDRGHLTWDSLLDAILAKLGFREVADGAIGEVVEGSVILEEPSGATINVGCGIEVAVLRPESASKEE